MSELQRYWPQPGGTAHPAGIAMMGRKQPGFDFIREYVLAPQLRHLGIEPLDIRQTTPENDHSWVQHVDHRSQSAGQPIFIARQNSLGQLIAILGSRHQRAASERQGSRRPIQGWMPQSQAVTMVRHPTWQNLVSERDPRGRSRYSLACRSNSSALPFPHIRIFA
jgi:hypothetical protein